jgi:hypothetical protein
MFEWVSPGFVYTLLKDAWTGLNKGRRRLTPEQVIDLRAKWKPQFEKYLWERIRDDLRTDIIIRDMKRLDRYPEAEGAARGISPWFRVGLAGTYHRGILVGHKWGTLTKDGDGWRFTDYQKGEQGDVKLMMVSSLPYENIEHVDWDGDEYYSFPHIYCWFTNKREPYEHTGLYTRNLPHGGLPYYTEFGNLKEITRRSRKCGGPKHFW